MEQQKRLQQDINSFTERNRDMQRKREAELRESMKQKMTPDEDLEIVGTGENAPISLLTPASTVRRPSLLVIETAAESMLDSPVASEVFRAPVVAPILTSTPPGELLLSPQYTTAVKAKKIFTVSKVDIQSLLSPTGPIVETIPVLSPSSLLTSSTALSQGDTIPSQITPAALQTILANPILCAPLGSVPAPPESLSSDLQTKPETTITEFVKDIVIDIADNATAMCDQCQHSNGEEETSNTEVFSNTDTSKGETETSCTDAPLNKDTSNTCYNENSTEDSFPSTPNPLKESGLNNSENEQWTQIESSEIPSSIMNGHAVLSKTTENPNFQSSLTMNGLTEELASVLESIENKADPGENIFVV